VANHTNWDNIPWRYLNLLTQFSTEKDILDIKLEDGPMLNRSSIEKSLDSGHMGNRSKSFIIITTVFLLKASASLIALK